MVYCVKVSFDILNNMIRTNVYEQNDNLFTDQSVICLSSPMDEYGIDTDIQGIYALRFFKTKPNSFVLKNTITSLTNDLNAELSRLSHVVAQLASIDHSVAC